MEHAPIVRRGQPRADLARDLGGLVLGVAADAAEQRRKILPVHVLHGEECVAVGFADVVDAADVDVGYLPGDADLGEKPGHPLCVAGHLLGKELQRHRLAQREIVGPVDLTHAALSQQADDPVSPGEHRARGEPASSDGIRRREP